MGNAKTPAVQIEVVFVLKNKLTEKVIFGPAERFYTFIPKQELEGEDVTKEFKFLATQIFAKELVEELNRNPELKEAISGQPWYMETDYKDGIFVLV